MITRYALKANALCGITIYLIIYNLIVFSFGQPCEGVENIFVRTDGFWAAYFFTLFCFMVFYTVIFTYFGFKEKCAYFFKSTAFYISLVYLAVQTVAGIILMNFALSVFSVVLQGLIIAAYGAVMFVFRKNECFGCVSASENQIAK